MKNKELTVKELISSLLNFNMDAKVSIWANGFESKLHQKNITWISGDTFDGIDTGKDTEEVKFYFDSNDSCEHS